MVSYIKKIFLYIGIFIVTYAILLIFLISSAYVNRESIQENFEDSAEFLCERETISNIEKDVSASRIDRYADSILLNIAYNFEPDDALKSVMWSSFYSDPKIKENKNFYSTVYNGNEKNKQYLRYWHGSAGVIRILHVFLNIKGIYILHAIIIAMLITVLIVVLLRFKLKMETLLFVFSLIAISVWYVPFSLEYTWVFICMLVSSLFVVVLVHKKKTKYLGVVFMITGIVTVYLDFLSTETLTLTIPLMLYLVIKKLDLEKNEKIYVKTELKVLAKNSALWLTGYLGMWIAKWITASIVLNENALSYVTEHIEERLGGEIDNETSLNYIWKAVYSNIRCIFPMDYGVGGVIIACVLLLLLLYICFVYRKKKIEWGYVILLTILGLVPYVRFLTLRNHSYLHSFFTYRALMASILAFLISAREIVDMNFFRKKRT